jgi:hypothetical protein
MFQYREAEDNDDDDVGDDSRRECHGSVLGWEGAHSSGRE